MGYELYSWQELSGGWDFCLLPSPSGVNIRAEQVFNKKFLVHEVHGLDRRISKLPVGATIYWFDRIRPEAEPEAKESRRLSYPPSNIIEQVRRHAETRRVEVQVLEGIRSNDRQCVSASCAAQIRSTASPR